MKIALVSQSEFNEIWSKLYPSERFAFDAPMIGVVSRITDTLIVVRTEEISAEEVLADIKSAHDDLRERQKNNANITVSAVMATQ